MPKTIIPDYQINIRGRQVVDTASRELLNRHPFYGHLVMQMRRRFDKTLTTYTSINVVGRSIVLYLRPEVNQLPRERIRALLENACLYMVLEYIRNRKYIEEPLIDAMASAIAANEHSSEKRLMKDMNSPTVEDFDFKGGETKEYYLTMLREWFENFKASMTPPSEFGGPHPPDPMNISGEDDAEDEELDQDPEKDLKNQIQPDDTPDQVIEKITKMFTELLDHNKSGDSNPDKGAVRQVVKHALQEAMKKSRGILPGGISKIVADILDTKTMPWNIILRRMMMKSIRCGSRNTWMKESRRMPGLVKGRKPEYKCNVFIVMDTSGSIEEKYISVFSNEMKIMAKHGHQILVIPCDTQVYTPYRFKDKLRTWDGGGGTTLKPGIDWIRDNVKETVDLVIILTDGACDTFPKPPYPVIWALEKDCTAPVDWGVQINLKE